MGLPNRKAPVKGGMNPNPPWTDPEFADQYPSLYSFLCDAQFEDGTPRAVGSISVFVKFNVLTCAVNDNARNVSAFVHGTTWAELLFKLDQGIGDDSLDWRVRNRNGNTQSPPF